MKPHKLQFIAIAILVAIASNPAFARPLEFSEISLLVRARESDRAIIDAASQRKLLHPLTPPQENTLRAQGASDSLIRSLHQSHLALSQGEMAAYETAKSGPAVPPPSLSSLDSRGRENIQMVDIATDQPANLSQWGGPDLEISFRGSDIVECGRNEVELIDPNASRVHYATYRGYRVPGWEPVDPEYTSITAHTFARSVHIDWRNPIQLNGVPYLLYPVYAFRGASIYFIGRPSDDTVRLAVVSR
jgi:hypothetical protein